MGARFVLHTGMGWPTIARGVGGAAIAVGPEGGFTDAEIDAAVAAGWQLASLGPRVLRVETAAVAAATLLGAAVPC